jgi:hypothetical protein
MLSQTKFNKQNSDASNSQAPKQKLTNAKFALFSVLHASSGKGF